MEAPRVNGTVEPHLQPAGAPSWAQPHVTQNRSDFLIARLVHTNSAEFNGSKKCRNPTAQRFRSMTVWVTICRGSRLLPLHDSRNPDTTAIFAFSSPPHQLLGSKACIM